MLVVAFMGVFLLLLTTITSYSFEQSKYGRAIYAREQSLHIADAGLEYYRWYLAHSPNDLTNGTGGSGPFTYVVNDQEAGTRIGAASLTITGNTQCGVIQSIDITSVGTADTDPSYKRTLKARYMQPSVAGYSYLLNGNVWAGADRDITGPYFSNGGIRMDGTNNSDVLSAVATWSCDSSYGCSPTQSKTGVFGAGSGSPLWHYPVSSIDFAGITTGLSNLKTYARNTGGVYFAPAAGTMSQRGYHLLFKADGTVDVYRVTSTTAVSGYSDQYGQVTENNIIASQVFVGNYAIPASCSVFFMEDRVWIEGIIARKVTVAAADFINANNSPDAYLANNITYSAYDGSVGLTLIAEGNVLIPLNSPDTMEVHGVFVAQTGHYGRNFYTSSGTYAVPSAYNSYVMQTQLTTGGTVVSNGRTGTSWSCSGSFCSGYATRVDSYDALQATNPPPFTPAASPDYTFVIWRDQQ
jgi:hypothetical protein